MIHTDPNWTDASDEAQTSVGDHPEPLADHADTPATWQNGTGTEAEIRRFLADIFFLGDDPASLPGSKSLIEAGILDSTGILELVAFLEEQVGIRIEDDDLTPENLDSIDNIVQFLARKRAS